MFRVTVRECLLLTLTVAMGLGWLVDQRRRDEEKGYWLQRVVAIQHAMLYHGFDVERHDTGIVITNRHTGERTFDPLQVPQTLAGRAIPHERLIEGSDKLSDHFN